MQKINFITIFFILFINNACNNKDNVHIEKTYYDNGALETEYQVKNSIKSGFYKSYYEDGTPKVICSYKDGVERGTYTKYYENGNIDFIAHLIGDTIMFGWSKKYDREGNLIFETEFLPVFPSRGYTERIDTSNIREKEEWTNQEITYRNDVIDTLNSYFFTINGVKGNSVFNDTYYAGDKLLITIKLETPKFENSKINVYIHEYDEIYDMKVEGYSSTFYYTVQKDLYYLEGFLIETNLEDESQRRGYFI